MHGAVAASPDVLALRMSRRAILGRLIDFGMEVVRGVQQGLATHGVCRAVRDFARISRWVGVAVFLSFRIGQGALDAPRQPPKARIRGAVDAGLVEAAMAAAEQRAERLAGDAELRPEREARQYQRLECYLDRPFGEVIALICRGIGMKPDWAAWSGELWAQAEIRARSPNCPFAGYAADPPAEPPAAPAKELPPPSAARPAHPRPSPPPDAVRPGAPPGPPPPPQNRKARRAQAHALRRRMPRASRAKASA